MRTPDSEAECRWFDSSRVRQQNTKPHAAWLWGFFMRYALPLAARQHPDHPRLAKAAINKLADLRPHRVGVNTKHQPGSTHGVFRVA